MQRSTCYVFSTYRKNTRGASRIKARYFCRSRSVPFQGPRGQTHPQAPERRAWEARTRATSAAQLCTLLVTVVVQLFGRIVCATQSSMAISYGMDVRCSDIWYSARGNRLRTTAQLHAGRPLARVPIRPRHSSPHPAPSRAPGTCQWACSLIGRASHLQRVLPSRGRRCDRHS